MPCQHFQQLAIDTWKNITDSRLASMPLKEESITDFNMLHLKLAIPHRVTIQTFTRKEEGINGADWEWWFHHGRQWLGFRVQSKILNIRNERFDHLHFSKTKKGVTTFQNDLLITHSRSFPAKIPIYCLYTQTPDPTRLTNWTCGTFGVNKHLYGCSLLSAYVVRSLRSTKVNQLAHPDSILKPWHCLVCCQGYGGTTPIEKMHNYAKTLFIPNSDILDEPDSDIPNSFITEEPPSYVEQPVNLKVADQTEAPDEYLAGIMICRLEEGES